MARRKAKRIQTYQTNVDGRAVYTVAVGEVISRPALSVAEALGFLIMDNPELFGVEV